MLNQKENIRNSILDAILVVMFLLFFLSLSNNSNNHIAKSNKPDISYEIIVSQSDAIINTDAPLAFNQKTWASEIKYPEFNNPDKYIISENRKTDNQISIQKNAVLKTGTVPIFIIHYYLFATEEDDLPFLS